ncbi:MAG: hypothetical protein JW793_09545 [Acidobacteria bacterium]|nr:hypothetical protein [Acidobacteriota bacterium]
MRSKVRGELIDIIQWTDGMAGWKPAGGIPALEDLFKGSPPPITAA